MPKHRHYRLCVAGTVLLLICSAAAVDSPPRLQQYVARVHFTSASAADISVAVQLKGDIRPSSPACRLVRYPKETIFSVSVMSGSSEVPVTTVERDGVLEVRPTDKLPNDYTVRYSVRSNESLRRIPMATIDPPPVSESAAVQVSVELMPGTEAIGGTFPAMTWQDATHGTARLSAVPSLVLLDAKRPEEVTFGDRWLTTTNVSTVAMFGFILLGSIIWYTRSR